MTDKKQNEKFSEIHELTKEIKDNLDENFSKFILSASGWRKIFALEGSEGRRTSISVTDGFLVFLACKCFEKFLILENEKSVIIGRDTRPTGNVLVKIAEKSFTKITPKNAEIVSAPEIMAHSKLSKTPFIYFSASHNPIGYNGIKFGLKTGGVLENREATSLINLFTESVKKISHLLNNQNINQSYKLNETSALDNKNLNFNTQILNSFIEEFIKLWEQVKKFSSEQKTCKNKVVNIEKQRALENYFNFALETISSSNDAEEQNAFCKKFKSAVKNYKKTFGDFCIVYDFNGSSRAFSIDKKLFEKFGLNVHGFNEEEIAHGIIPEGENLKYSATKMQELYSAGKNPLFAIMPDCDGDRGNPVFWDSEKNKAIILNAQEVFALSVLSELSFIRSKKLTKKPVAVVVNCATSLRIHKIAAAFDAKIFTAEVGESNVVTLARNLQASGYYVRILGEGSNGGNITFPESVRDPLNTIFAILKLLLFRDYNSLTLTTKQNTVASAISSLKFDTSTSLPSLYPFELWQELYSKAENFKANFTLQDIIKSLPAYTTTATQEERALLHIKVPNHEKLKKAYQKVFTANWQKYKNELYENYGFDFYAVLGSLGIEEFSCEDDFSKSKTGGLKIQFYSKDKKPIAFIWMRGSKTEPVFRIMADVKGSDEKVETALVHWQGRMLKTAWKNAFGN